MLEYKNVKIKNGQHEHIRLNFLGEFLLKKNLDIKKMGNQLQNYDSHICYFSDSTEKNNNHDTNMRGKILEKKDF